MKLTMLKIAGIALLIIGAVVLILGISDLISFNSSTFGKVANWMGKQVGSRPEAVRNAIIQILIGAGAAASGFFLFRKG